MRVAVVHDLPSRSALLSRIVVSTGLHQIAWNAATAGQAVECAVADPPDAILIDLDMPNMDGVETTRRIMLQAPCPVIVTTRSVDDNLHLVFKAMGAGAIDVAKGPGDEMEMDIRDASELLRKISLVGLFNNSSLRVTVPVGADELLVVGASTGGPQAIVQLLANFIPGPKQAVILVQHVDAHFAPRLVEYLADETQLRVVGVKPGCQVDAETVYVATAEQHLIVDRQGRLNYVDEPKRVPHRPSIDVFFNSVAAHWQGSACGVLLTGMGRDGAQGLLRLRQQGRYTVAQDELSCAVYGMPRAAKEIGAAVDILSPDKIGLAVKRRFEIGNGHVRRIDAI